MTDTAALSTQDAAPDRRSLMRWVRSKDPQLLGVKRSVRAAVVVPLAFAVGYLFFADPQVGLFAAFGAFALMLLAEFSGRPRVRTASFLVLFVVGCAFIALGTLVSTDKALAIVSMAVVGFAVLFAGVVAPQVATGSTSALLTFVLAVAIAAPVSSIGPRLTGWAIAGVICIPACLFVWPPPWHDPLRLRLSTTLTALAQAAAAHARGDEALEAHAAVAAELTRLRAQFSATPYPPTGAASNAVALSKLVGRVEWLVANATLAGAGLDSPDPQVRDLLGAVATALHSAAAVLCDRDGHPIDDPARVDALRVALERLQVLIGAELDMDMSAILDAAREPASHLPDPVAEGGDQQDLGSGLDPGFHVRALGVAAAMAADAALAAAGAETVVDKRLGAEPTSRNVIWRLTTHLSARSVWFRNSVRGAVGLALAVLVVEVTDVSHGFWVVLGTLSVLRSNALSTGATALRAVAGTAVGFVVGSLIMVGVSDHWTLLWVLLPLSVLISGTAPFLISFAAGQAGFTLVVIILFNILQPTGWKVGLTRIEDVAIGCAVSVVVGALFWPRGATAAFGRALSKAFVANSGYLSDAVDRLTITSRVVDTEPGLQASHLAYLLLDDAFRQYFAERGAKVISVEAVSRLFTGANRLRLAAYALTRLPSVEPAHGETELESVAVAGAVLRDSYAMSHRWYEEFGELLNDRRHAMGEPPVHDAAVLHHVLRRAFEDARARRRTDGLEVTLQMLWADQLLENQAQVQADLALSAAFFVRGGRWAA